MVYCCSFATLGSPLMVCMPPAACQVEPEVSSSRSTRTMSVQPSFAKGYRTEQPTTPPPTTTTRAEFLMMSGLLAAALGPPPLDIGVERFANRGIHRGLHVLLQRAFPDVSGTLRGITPAGDLPVFIVLPIRYQRPVERMLIALHGV